MGRSELKTNKVVVLLFQEDTSKLSRVLRKLNVDYQILEPNDTPNFIPTHIILSGSPKSVYDTDAYPLPSWVLASEAKVLGICYGMQLIAHTFGGIVWKMLNLEHGPTKITEIRNGRQKIKTRMMNHQDQVVKLPETFDITAVTNKNHIASFTDHKRFWAVQYHPEDTNYPDLRTFKRFLKQ